LRNIIITGANNGIGLGMTKALATRGERLAALDLSGENLSLLAENIRFYPCDVTDVSAVEATVNDAVQRAGTVDVLINNACRAVFGSFETRTFEDLHAELEVNLFGYLNMIHAVLPAMRRQGYGIIHNVGSGVGYTGFPRLAGYTASKAAIEGLTRTLALELTGSGITVNVMHPPLTRTRSASPLGIPPEMMADPEVVGRRLAAKVGSRHAFITPDMMSALGTFANQHFPLAMGRLLSSMAKRAERRHGTSCGQERSGTPG
jgi:NAD(P)-dependent dehydrogenase (short-subunit alcohol dehydrogenase family)